MSMVLVAVIFPRHGNAATTGRQPHGVRQSQRVLTRRRGAAIRARLSRLSNRRSRCAGEPFSQRRCCATPLAGHWVPVPPLNLLRAGGRQGNVMAEPARRPQSPPAPATAPSSHSVADHDVAPSLPPAPAPAPAPVPASSVATTVAGSRSQRRYWLVGIVLLAVIAGAFACSRRNRVATLKLVKAGPPPRQGRRHRSQRRRPDARFASS